MYLIQLREAGCAEPEMHMGGSEVGQERVIVVAEGGNGAASSVDCWAHPCINTSFPAKPLGL